MSNLARGLRRESNNNNKNNSDNADDDDDSDKEDPDALLKIGLFLLHPRHGSFFYVRTISSFLSLKRGLSKKVCYCVHTHVRLSVSFFHEIHLS